MLEVLYQNSWVTLRTFNILLALGFLITGAFLIRFSAKRKMNLSFMAKYGALLFLIALLGGRIAYIFENLTLYLTHPIYILYIWDLNFSFFGILYSIVIALVLFGKKAKEDYEGWWDILAISLMLMLVFVHVGQFFSGENYGMPTDLPWGIAFDTQNIPFVNPIHPTQLYSALVSGAIFTFAYKRIKRLHISGIMGNLALMLYSLSSISIDLLHGTPSLYSKISYAIIAACSFIWYVHCSHKKTLN